MKAKVVDFNSFEVALEQNEIFARKNDPFLEQTDLLCLFLDSMITEDMEEVYDKTASVIFRYFGRPFSIVLSINLEIKSKVSADHALLKNKTFYYRHQWKSAGGHKNIDKYEFGTALVYPRESEIICLKKNDEYFIRIFLGVKEGQEFYFIFSIGNSLLDFSCSPLIYLKKFLQNRFYLSGQSDILNRYKSLIYLDDVTGLYNQRKLIKDLEHFSKKYADHGTPFAVLFIDIDHFKKVNDGHGHLTGTHLLADLAVLLKKILRESDLIYRYGGDEFVMILPHFTPVNAKKIGERILRSIKKEVFLKNTANVFKLSVSIGIAGVPEHAQGAEAILAMADQMMYTAKNSGRGKVCMAGEIFE